MCHHLIEAFRCQTGDGGGKRGKQQPKKKGKSGNPAKRAQQEREAAQKAQAAREASLESAFGGGAFGQGEDGMPSGQGGDDLAGLKLPAGFEKFLGDQDKK